MCTGKLTVPSFAKVNWILKVLGRRPDGLHELLTLFQSLDLRDELSFEVVSSPAIQIEVEGRAVEDGPHNLVYRAARLVQSHCGVRRGVKIRLRKSIPVGAGLGGGSGNAAVTLMALNQLWDCQMGRAEMKALGAGLGADVSFFFEGGAALGQGAGEDLQSLPDPSWELPVLLLYPRLEISTRQAYELGGWPPLNRDLLLTKNTLNTRIQRFCRSVDPLHDLLAIVENDFEEPILREFPQLAETCKSMLQAGCRKVMLCGSGSTLMGLADAEILKAAAERLSQNSEMDAFLCPVLTRRRYWEILSEAGLSRG